MQYVNQLRELSLHMDLERLPIPKEVIEYVSRFFMEVFMQHDYTWYRVADKACFWILAKSIRYEPDLKSRGRETNFELTYDYLPIGLCQSGSVICHSLRNIFLVREIFPQLGFSRHLQLCKSPSLWLR